MFPGDELTAVKDPVVRLVDGVWHAWICCHHLDIPGEEDRMSTAYASSADGLEWTWHGTVLSGRPGEWDARGARLTTLLPGGWVAYDGRRNAAENWFERCGLARTGGGTPAPGYEVLDGEPVADLRYLDAVQLDDGAVRLYYEHRLPDESHELRTEYVPARCRPIVGGRPPPVPNPARDAFSGPFAAPTVVVSRTSGRRDMYTLGVDLGTTFTAAAVRRPGPTRPMAPEVVQLGTRTAAVPSVALVREDGVVLVGEAAQRRALTEPDRVAREFKRRFGDPTPLLVGGTPWSPQALTARLLADVVARVTEREGEPPAAICVSHPASWGPYLLDLLDQTVRLADFGAGTDVELTFVTEPEAAAAFYARRARLRPGAVVAVYDLGGGTFDAAVLRRTATGFELLGQPEGIEHLGGVDVDAAVFSHVARALDGALDELDVDDPDVTAAVQRLRQECTQAKEALSADTDVTIPVLLPGLTTEVRLTRGELEDLIRPALLDSVGAMRRAVRSAGVDVADLHSVLLVGGSSRIPLVSQLVATELGRPVAVDADPKHAVALGAACVAGQAQLTQVIPAVPRQATDPFAAPPAEPKPVAAEPKPVAAEPKPVAARAEAGTRARA